MMTHGPKAPRRAARRPQTTRTAPLALVLSALGTIASVGPLGVAGVVGTSWLGSACSPARCDYDLREPERAVSTFQCPSGDLCYQGDCKRACEPGREGATPCSSDSDCTEAALPYCVSSTIKLGSSFCSSCDLTDTCVPELGICQPVVDIQLPEQPSPTQMAPPPLPLDGGFIDGSVFERDSGVGPIEAEAVSHTGSVQLGQRVDYRGGGQVEEPFVAIRFSDVTAGEVGREGEPLFQQGQCEVVSLTEYTSQVPADLGDVSFEPAQDTPDAMMLEVSASFDEGLGTYTTSPAPLPSGLLRLSEIEGGVSRFINVGSAGVAMLVLPWPARAPGSPAELFHLPFRLDPEVATVSLLASPIVVPEPPVDLELGWAGVPESAGRIGGEQVRFQIQAAGSPYLLRCTEVEGFPQSQDSIVVPASLLTDYRMLTAGEAAERTVTFERVFEQRIAVDGARPGVIVDVTLSLTHVFVGTATF